MGRLFWKFFFAFWLALLVAGVGVGSMVWWRQQIIDAPQPGPETIITDHRVNIFIDASAEVLQYGGVEALKSFLNKPRHKPFPPVYALDHRDRDIFNRHIETAILQQVRTFSRQQTYPEALRRVDASNGDSYLLFVILPEYKREESVPGTMPPPPGRHRHHPGPPPSPIIPIVSGLIASLLFSALLAWYFARPIRNLRNAFTAAAQGDLATHVAQKMGARHDELTDLGRDFDHMAEQLDSLINAQQRLLNDVSHELRSPLARMQAAIGLAQQQPDKMSSTLERIDRESQRISDLIGELLLLSRLETNVKGETNTEIELGGLLADIVEDARFEAEQKGVKLRYSGFEEEDIIVEARCELLHRALENVLRNAVQHCPKGCEVGVVAEFDTANRRLDIAIADQGPGVDEADLKAIFQPFFRGGRQDRPDSIGLGLTIAQQAVKALGGTIDASNRPQGGLLVKITAPFQIL